MELEASIPLGKMLCPKVNLSNQLYLIIFWGGSLFFFLLVFHSISPFSSKVVAFKPLEA